MTHIVFHIPHSSLKIPKVFWNICVRDKKCIMKSNIFMCDYLIDKLLPNKCHKVIFKYSRLFCDVERFDDDSKELMSNKGMGVIYTHDCDSIITIPNNKYRKKVLKSYYYKYHNKLDKTVTNLVKKNNKCIIIDLHSFSDEMVIKILGSNNSPDICIGTNSFFTNKKLLDFTVEHFKKYGYSIDINKPYSGTIVPNGFVNKKTTQVSSIMIEINKRIYMNNRSDFIKLKECIDEYYNCIQLL